MLKFLISTRVNKYILFSYSIIISFIILTTISANFFYLRDDFKSSSVEKFKLITHSMINNFKGIFTSSVNNYLRGIAEKNRDIVKNLYQQFKQGNISESEAKNRAKELLLSQKIGNSGYIYCLDSKGVVKVHPKKALINKSVFEHDFVKRQILLKSGYLEYLWKNPDETVEREKALSMTYFEPWDWIISVSSYKSEFLQLVNLTDFREHILSMKSGDTGYGFIFSKSGLMLIHPDIPYGTSINDLLGKDQQYVLEDAIREKSGMKEYKWYNPITKIKEPKLVYFDTYDELDIIAAFGTTKEEFFKPISKLKSDLTILGISLLLLGIPFYWILYLGKELDKKKLQEDQLKREKEIADKANCAKSTFLANMSHELRTPLNAILGFSSILESSQNLASNEKEHLKIINSAGERLLSMINDVLDLSKIEVGKFKLQKSEFNLIALCDELKLMFFSRAKRKSISLVVETDKIESSYFFADHGKINQVLINIMGNALKFTEKGAVIFRVRTEKIENTDTMHHILFEIEDSGIGIAKEDIDKIFNSFEQARPKAHIKGTGLGLAISKGFIELMSGEITVESEIDKGTTFKIRIPVEASNNNLQESKLSGGKKVIGLKPDQKPPLILIVDDNFDNRALLSNILTNTGFRIIFAENGIQAVELFKKYEKTDFK